MRSACAASSVLSDQGLLRRILSAIFRDRPMRVLVLLGACRGIRDAAARLASPLAIGRVVRLIETWEWVTFASRERPPSHRESVTRLVHALVLEQAHEWWAVCPFRIHAIGDVARHNNRGSAWPPRFAARIPRRRATALLAACGEALDEPEPIAHLLNPRLPRKRTVKGLEELQLLLRDRDNADEIEKYGTCAAYDIRPLESLEHAFRYLDGDVDVTFWDTSRVTDMSLLAFGRRAGRDARVYRGIELWNTARVQRMWGSFWLAEFDQNIGGWDVGRVVTMTRMFSGSTFNRDIGKWDTSSVMTMTEMFDYCAPFDEDIGTWDVSNVTEMDSMFRDAVSFSRDLSSWRVGNVTSCRMVLHNCPLAEERRPRLGVTVIGPGASALRPRIAAVLVASLVGPESVHVVCVDRAGPTRIEINRSLLLAARRSVCRDIIRYACSESSDVRFNWVAPLNKPTDWTCTAQRAKEAKEAADAWVCAVS
jgi:surface protein